MNKKIKTWRVIYDGKDDYGEVEFCSVTESEALELFKAWCKKSKYDDTYKDVYVVWNYSDAYYYEDKYISYAEYEEIVRLEENVQ